MATCNVTKGSGSNEMGLKHEEGPTTHQQKQDVDNKKKLLLLFFVAWLVSFRSAVVLTPHNPQNYG